MDAALGSATCVPRRTQCMDAALGSATCQALCPQAYLWVTEAALGQYRGRSLVEIHVGGFTLQNKCQHTRIDLSITNKHACIYDSPLVKQATSCSLRLLHLQNYYTLLHDARITN